MFPSQILQIPLAQADFSQAGERTEMKGRGEEIVRNIQQLQTERRNSRILITAARPHNTGQACISDLGWERFVFIFSTVIIELSFTIRFKSCWSPLSSQRFSIDKGLLFKLKILRAGRYNSGGVCDKRLLERLRFSNLEADIKISLDML